MKHSNNLIWCAVAVIAIAVTFSTSSCKKKDNNNNMTMTLYDSLGGTAMVADPSNSGQMIEKGRLGIRSVVDSAIFVIAADTAINGYFTVLLAEVTSGNTSGFTTLSKNLTDFFCVATGAKDFTYAGKNMVDAHNPATNPRISKKVASDDFTEFINDVGISAQKNNIPSYLTARLVTVMNSVMTQVVQQ